MGACCIQSTVYGLSNKHQKMSSYFGKDVSGLAELDGNPDCVLHGALVPSGPGGRAHGALVVPTESVTRLFAHGAGVPSPEGAVRTASVPLDTGGADAHGAFVAGAAGGVARADFAVS
jgi:hypothetical protein